MEDRELFEMAAKAIDIRIKLVKSKVQEGKLFCLRINGGETKPWNPLEHDGDALRLAVLLKIDVKHYDDHVVGWCGYIGTGRIPYDKDPYAATRRAIFFAAALIEKYKEKANV